MSKTNIETMPAGREMDALVAEKVMGWEFTAPPADTEKTKWCHYCGRLMADWDEPSEHDGSCEFSADIDAAWEVVEKLKRDGIIMSINNSPRDTTSSCIAQYQRPGDGRWQPGCDGETAPLAICRAALKAIGL